MATFTNWCNLNKTGIKTKGGLGRPINLGVNMQHVFKVPGTWQKDGVSYTIKAVNDVGKYLSNGWSSTLEEAINKCEDKPINPDVTDNEKLRLEAESLGIKFRSNIKQETLKAKIEQAKAEKDDT